jgi:hypothetical protein
VLSVFGVLALFGLVMTLIYG